MAAIKMLLDRYGIADPAAGQPIGVFTNPDLQALYNQLIAQGNQSLAAALQVGVTIEEVDIRDLQTRLAGTTHADIKQVYTNLMNGSYNHLRAFMRTAREPDWRGHSAAVWGWHHAEYHAGHPGWPARRLALNSNLLQCRPGRISYGLGASY